MLSYKLLHYDSKTSLKNEYEKDRINNVAQIPETSTSSIVYSHG